MKLVAAVMALVACVGHASSSVSAQERPPIIDTHMHAHLPDVPPGTPTPCDPQPCQTEGQATSTAEETLRETLAIMDRYNIVHAFLSGDDLTTVRAWTAAAPTRFLPSVFIWQAGEPTPKALRTEYAAGRLTGMGRSRPNTAVWRQMIRL